jgi:hypothetical protein
MILSYILSTTEYTVTCPTGSVILENCSRRRSFRFIRPGQNAGTWYSSTLRPYANFRYNCTRMDAVSTEVVQCTCIL